MGNWHTTNNDLTSRNLNTYSNNQNLESTQKENIFHCKKRENQKDRGTRKKWKEE